MLQGNREIQKWVCGKPTNTSTFTKPPQLWSDVVFCVIHLSGGLETTNGMRSTKPQHKVSYYCASKFMIMKNMKATCSSILFCTFHWIWLASHLALLVDPAGHDFGDNFYVWMDLNGMFHGQVPFLLQIFPLPQKNKSAEGTRSTRSPFLAGWDNTEMGRCPFRAWDPQWSTVNKPGVWRIGHKEQ